MKSIIIVLVIVSLLQIVENFSLQHRIDKLEARIEALSDWSNEIDPPGVHRINKIEDRLESLSGLVQGMERELP